MPKSFESILDMIKPPEPTAQGADNVVLVEFAACRDADNDTELAATEGIVEANEELKALKLKNVHLEEQTNELKLNNSLLDEQLKDSQQNRAQRQEYANKIFWLVCYWLFGLGALIVCDGAKKLTIPEPVLLALITGTSVNVIALMAIVANHLFPKNGNGNTNGSPKKPAVKSSVTKK